MSFSGSSSRKHPERTSSTSWRSFGEALWTDTARGRLFPAAIARIFAPCRDAWAPRQGPLFRTRERGIDEGLLRIQFALLAQTVCYGRNATSSLPLRTHC